LPIRFFLASSFREMRLAQNRPRQGDLLRSLGHDNAKDVGMVHTLHHAQDRNSGRTFESFFGTASLLAFGDGSSQDDMPCRRHTARCSLIEELETANPIDHLILKAIEPILHLKPGMLIFGDHSGQTFFRGRVSGISREIAPLVGGEPASRQNIQPNRNSLL
jgi:hypothetical protein